MRTLDQWLGDYAVSHQNPTNRKIHTFCVPAIFFSILGMLWSLQLFNIPASIYLMILFAPFYLRLGMKAFGLIFMQFAISAVILYFWTVYFQSTVPVLWGSLAIFFVAWIGQFIGHKIEGKKPSFFEDLQFLLIGPLWVILK